MDGATVAVTADAGSSSVLATEDRLTIGATMCTVEVGSMVCVISKEAEACRRRATPRRRPEEMTSATEQVAVVKPVHTSASRALRICAVVTPAGRGVLTAAVCSMTTSTFSAWAASPPVAALESVVNSDAGLIEPRLARLSETSEVMATLTGGKGGGEDGRGSGMGGGGEKRWLSDGRGGGDDGSGDDGGSGDGDGGDGEGGGGVGDGGNGEGGGGEGGSGEGEGGGGDGGGGDGDGSMGGN